MIWAMKENLIEPIRAFLAGMTQEQRRQVADACGVPFPTIQKIATGETPDPRVSTWAAIAEYMGAVCAIPKASPPAPNFKDAA